MTELERLVGPSVEKAVESGDVAGMAVAAAWDGGKVQHVVAGADAAGRALAHDTLFAVASITKLATALAVLRLADAGVLAPEDELARHLPEAAAARSGVTLTTLLCHTAGLPGDLPPAAAPYRPGLDWPALRRACCETAPLRPPRTRIEYSNVGYGLLAAVVERCSGLRFAAALSELVLEPLGIEAYLGEEPPRTPAAVHVEGLHTGTPIEVYNSAFWRSLALPWGGLLTTAEGAIALVRAFGGVRAGFLRPETAAAATRDHVGDLERAGDLPWVGGPWGLGPELRGTKSPHWTPAEAGPGSFGHAGASGCVTWSSPSAGVSWTILHARQMTSLESAWLLRGGGSLIGAALLGAAPAPGGTT